LVHQEFPLLSLVYLPENYLSPLSPCSHRRPLIQQ
jgi:hypothetical protein